MTKYSYIFLTTLSLIAVTLGLAWEKAIEAANVLVTATMWAGVTVLVLLPLGLLATGLGLGGWFLSNRLIDNRQKRAEADMLAAQAQQAAKQAENLIVTAAPGEQVFLIADADISHRSVSALHLQQSYRANGSGDQPTLLESAAWALVQHLHSTANVPKSVSATHNAAQLPAGSSAESADILPQRVDLLPLIGSEAPSLSRIIIGQSVDEAGRLETVTASLGKMVHVGMVASSGFGKSVGMQSLALQLALANETVEICFIDAVEGVTSAPFERCNRLRYPVAHTPEEGLAILNDLQEEMKRRMALFQPHRAQKLEQYNALSDEPLPYIACFFDEVTVMMESYPQMHDLVARMMTQLRKTGIFFFLAGQEMTAKSMRPIIRRQISSRFVYHINDHWQAQGLGMGKEATKLNTEGRAWAILPGRKKLLLQTPYIEASDIEHTLAKYGRLGDGVSAVMPEVEETKPFPAEKPLTKKQRQIVQFYQGGTTNISELAKLVYGDGGGRQRKLVKIALKKAQYT